MPDKLSMLIADIERRVPNPDGTFAEILGFLHKLQRIMAALQSCRDNPSNSFSTTGNPEYDSGLDDGFTFGFERCLDRIDREAAERAKSSENKDE